MAIVVVNQEVTPGQAVVITPTFNFEHFKTPHGILQLVEFVVGIVILCLSTPIWLTVISWIGWIVTHTLIWVYLFSVNRRYTSNPPMHIVEFYFVAGAAALYALSTLLGFIFLYWISAIFAAINTVAYGASAFFLFKDWKAYRDQTLPK